jgi:RHS repeat-associated protein
MAGDQLSATTQYYYQNAVTNTTGNNLTTSIVTALVQSILGSPATGLAKGNTTNISTQLNANTAFNTATAPDANNATGTNPKAYMTIVFFDERFNYVAENSMALRVSQQGDNAAPLVLANIKAPKNGFAYIYLSNESNEPVYFDNFTVSDTRGRIIEEDHYYAFGLKIAAISSVKLGDPDEGSLKNNNLYNDKELFDDADLDWYDYGFRNYDPQIGRFPQLDPLTDKFPELTPYQYASDEPIANVDMDGLENLNALSAIPTGALAVQKTLAPVILVGLSKAVKSSSSFFSHVWNLVKTAAKIRWKADINSLKTLGHHISTNFNNDVIQVKILANQLNANAKRNWASGNTLIQQVPKDFMENPLEFLEGGGELDVLKGLGMESEAGEELGIVYERISKTGERYVGQAKSEAHFEVRKSVHNRKLGETHKYNELGRAKPGQDLNVLEETHIRQGGGPMKKGGKLANKRYQMNDVKYKAAGGTVPKPTL